MAQFVLLHGGGMGGWVWRDVARQLRSAAHIVHTPTFTGFGERSHLLSREITHAAHVLDIVNYLHYNDVCDAVLVGYSYGGSVVPGVVRAAAHRIASVIYFDGIVPSRGESVAETMGYMDTDTAREVLTALKRGEGNAGTGVDVMIREAAEARPYKMAADKQAWMLDHMSDMPMRCMVDPVETGADTLRRPVHYLAAMEDVMVPMHGRARALGWTVTELDLQCDHSFVIGHPGVAADFLLAHGGNGAG